MAKYTLLRGKKRIGNTVYQAGDVVELTESQAMTLRYSVRPVTTSSGGVKPVTEDPSPPLHAQTAEGRSVMQLRSVISGTTDLSTLDDIHTAERQGAGRKSVFRAIEKRKGELASDTSTGTPDSEEESDEEF